MRKLAVAAAVLAVAAVAAVTLLPRSGGSGDPGVESLMPGCESGDIATAVEACTAIIPSDIAETEEVIRAFRLRAAAYDRRGDSDAGARDRALATRLERP